MVADADRNVTRTEQLARRWLLMWVLVWCVSQGVTARSTKEEFVRSRHQELTLLSPMEEASTWRTLDFSDTATK